MTGVTLPLVSYGGSSVMSTLLMLGIIQGLYILREDEDEEIERHRKQRRKEQRRLQKESMKQKKSRNREYTFVSWFFVLIFVSMIGYLIYFNAVESEEFINSPYNTRQDTFPTRVIRGNILSSDGEILATTQVYEDGTEERYYPYGNAFAHVVGFDSNGKSGLESEAEFFPAQLP